MRKNFIALFGAVASFSVNAHAEISTADTTATDTPEYSESQTVYPEQNWGLAGVFRTSTMPYRTSILGVNSDESDTVTSFIPMMFYEGENVFIRGTEAGAYLWKEDKWDTSVIGRLHYVDIPKQFQNAVGGDTTDFGLQTRYRLDKDVTANLDLLWDEDARFHAEVGVTKNIHSGNWFIQPQLTARVKSSSYNNYYYSINGIGDDIGAGVDLKAGVKGRYHVASNFYLVGGAYATLFEKELRDSPAIQAPGQLELYTGIAFFNNQDEPRKTSIKNRPYLRIAHGWATPSNIGDILGGKIEDDKYDNQMTSVFYGYPLTDELFGLPIDVYLTPGVVWHWSSKVQSSTQELVTAIKAYYNFDWPTKWRFGLAEGLSFARNITYIEQAEMDKKGYRPSHLLNYLDFSVDVNVGDLFNQSELDNVWLGYSIHHRSAIFETASQFGRIKGGSNYNTFYVQFSF
ncbi:MipA/OmpV family protein [Parasalinivibrio latis]|uniref:MipA/OmpV family protein n=1 Tax=Parasalinivibrio latis TaxID=2952610 RepID=UPI0030DF6245